MPQLFLGKGREPAENTGDFQSPEIFGPRYSIFEKSRGKAGTFVHGAFAREFFEATPSGVVEELFGKDV